MDVKGTKKNEKSANASTNGSEVRFLRPSIRATVASWARNFMSPAAGSAGSNPPTTEYCKAKHVEVHSLKPLIASTDRDSWVSVWDYSRDRLLVNCSIHTIVHLSKTVPTAYANHEQPLGKQYGTSALSTRLSLRISERMQGLVRNRQRITDFSQSSPPIRATAIDDVKAMEAAHAKVRQLIGSIRHVCFLDSYGCDADKLCSEEILAVVCEHALILLDCSCCTVGAVAGVEAPVCRVILCLTAADLQRGKAKTIYNTAVDDTPDSPSSSYAGSSTCSCVEGLAASGIFALGCGDGRLRIWRMKNRTNVQHSGTIDLDASDGAQQALVLPAAPRNCEIALIKNIPVFLGGSERGGHRRSRVLCFASITVDGQAFIWELMQTEDGTLEGENEDKGSTSSSILPLARLKDSLGAGLSRQNVFFDAACNMLITCSNEKKIKLWDMDEIKFARLNRKRFSSGAGGNKRNAKPQRRGTIASAFRGGGTSDSDISSEAVYCLSSVGSLKPQKKVLQSGGSFGRIASFTPLLHNSYFPLNAFIIAAKTNAIGIVQDCGGLNAVGDEESDRSSTFGSSASEKSIRLRLYREYALCDLMRNFLTTDDNISTECTDSSVKVYSVQTMAASGPWSIAVGTSIGLLVIRLHPQMPGADCGSHSSWGGGKLLASEAGLGVKIAMLPFPRIPQKESSVVVDKDGPESSGRMSAEEQDDGQLELITLQEFTTIEAVNSLFGDSPSVSLRGSKMGMPNLMRQQSARKNSAAAAAVAAVVDRAENVGVCRPQFHPSPSGLFCCVHWMESMVFVILQVKAPIKSEGNDQGAFECKEVSRGSCQSFAWIGMDDMFLIKQGISMTRANTSIGGKAQPRRGSVTSMFFGARKEDFLLQAPELVLMQCELTAGKCTVVTRSLHLKKIVRKLLPTNETTTPTVAADEENDVAAQNTTNILQSQVASGVELPQAWVREIQPSHIECLHSGHVLGMSIFVEKLSPQQGSMEDASLISSAQQQSQQESVQDAGTSKRVGAAAGIVAMNQLLKDGTAIVSDVDEVIQEVKYGSTLLYTPHQSVTEFYALVPVAWLQHELRNIIDITTESVFNTATASAQQSTRENKPRRRTTVSAAAQAAAAIASATEVEKTAAAESVAALFVLGSDNGYRLVRVGPILAGASCVRWDYGSGLCAMLIDTPGSSTISILRLILQTSTAPNAVAYPEMNFEEIHNFDCSSYNNSSAIAINKAVASLAWIGSGTLCTTLTGASYLPVWQIGPALPQDCPSSINYRGRNVMCSAREIRVASIAQYSTASTECLWRGSVPMGNGLVSFNSILGMHHGRLHVLLRDGTFFGVPILGGDTAMTAAVLVHQMALLKSNQSDSDSTMGLIGEFVSTPVLQETSDTSCNSSHREMIIAALEVQIERLLTQLLTVDSMEAHCRRQNLLQTLQNLAEWCPPWFMNALRDRMEAQLYDAEVVQTWITAQHRE